MKKGFTLVELLAVIVILGIILVIAVPNVLNIVNKSREDVYEKNEDILEDVVKKYVITNPDSLPIEVGEKAKITLEELQDKHYIGEIKNPKNQGEVCDGYVEIEKTDVNKCAYKGYLKCGNDYTTVGYQTFSMLAKTFGGSNDDYFSSVASAADGYIVTGSSNSNNSDLTGLNKGSSDGILVKYNTLGNVAWAKTYGGSATDSFLSLVSVASGYVAVGYSGSTTGDLSGLNKGGTDGIIAKYDLNGNISWNKNYGGDNSDYFRDLTAVTDGYIAVGSSDSINDDLAGLNKGSTDATIVKYDLNGNMVWNKNFGGDGSDSFYGITSVTDGYIVVGQSSSTNDDLAGLTMKGDYDGIIVKFDLNGNILWKNNFGGSSSDEFSEVITTASGYIVSGQSFSTDGDLEGLSGGLYEGLLIKYDLNGNLVWKNVIGGSDFEFFEDLIETNDGYMIVGKSGSVDGDLVGIDSKGGWDALIIKCDLNGDILWKRNFGGGEFDHFSGLIKTTDDYYIVVGNSPSSDGDLAGLAKGGDDAVFVKYSF